MGMAPLCYPCPTGTSFTPGLPLWLPLLSLRGHPSQQGPIRTRSSGQAAGVQGEGKAPEMPPRGASRSLWCQEVALAPSLLQGWSEHGRARLGSTEAHRVPVPIPGTGIARKPPGCPTRFPARDFPLGFTCSWLWAPGWESGRPAGTGDDYSHFPALLTPRSRFRFLNPHPSIFFVVFFGGEGSLAEGWCLLQGPLSRSGRPT